MNTDWFRTFLVAAQLENFHEAAESLYLTQSSVSLQIQHLEARLGVDLFRKAGRNVTLTEAGREFLPYARAMVDLLDKGQHHLKEWKQGYRGQLVIAASSLVASALLPQLLSRFVVEHPDFDVITKVFHSLEVASTVASDQADLGLCRIMPVRPDLHTSVVLIDKVVLVASQQDSMRNFRDLLSSYRLLVYSHPIWEQVLLELQPLGIVINTMNVSHVEVTKHFIAAGLGISFLPKHAICDDMSRSDLREVATPGLAQFYDQVYLVTSVKHPLSVIGEIFRKFITEYLPAGTSEERVTPDELT